MARQAKKTVKTKQESAVKQAKEVFEVTEYDQYLFGMGTHYQIYQKLGAHLTERDGKEGVYFAVWAPNALKVSVVGDFNGWDVNAHVMERLEPLGIHALFIPGVLEHSRYKYCVFCRDGRKVMKADPFGIHSEVRPATASMVERLEGYTWKDSEWMEKRKGEDQTKKPMFIYEVHPGSWKKHPYSEANPQGFYNYKQLAHSLADYVLEMGYTHVELMGIAEHPFDGSWGYQVTGYFAPTSRYGNVHDFMYLVDYLHGKGIGVLLDWVPAHFPKDECGLALFDGTCQFEYADPRKGEHPDWGTKVFDYSKNEVRNFLISNALYWLDEYHIDGLRVDAVASMLYLDYGRNEWVPNQYGGKENLEAVEFLKHLNSLVEHRGDGSIIIAEESTAWPQVTDTPENGGLGFTMKWNMGWMNDFLSYMQKDPVYRKYHHNQMNFGMMYAYSEKFILVLSHDEVVHGKCSLVEKMPGYPQDKLENLKAAYGFFLGHPGKKLLFMGQDFAQNNEWSEAKELDWGLMKDPGHKQVHDYMKALISLYRNHPCLYELDTEEKGFEWISVDDADRSIFSFVRHSKDGKDNLLFVCNFTPVEREDYRVGVLKRKQHTLILDSTWENYEENQEIKVKPEKIAVDGKAYSIAHPLKGYGVLVFKF
ncbi:MAG: 1,4-alpha-glucan branching protein GlgB [Oliverpabstia sp.]